LCRLFGLIANKPVGVEFSFLKADTPFKSLGHKNPDGWGFGYYESGVPKIFKETVSMDKSPKPEELAKQCKSSIIISHVRQKTKGEPKLTNTHPFAYGKWLFAHNGSVSGIDYLKEKISAAYKKHIHGETDSEALFIWLIQNIEQKGILDGLETGLKFIEDNFDKATSLNFLLTDGSKLYALRKAYIKQEYYSLYYLVRDPEHKPIYEYKSAETRQLIHSKLLNEEKAVIICSEKLTEDENWHLIDNNTLLTIDGDLKISKIKI